MIKPTFLSAAIMMAPLSGSILAHESSVPSDRLSETKPTVYKLETPNAEIARKVAISFHHAVLETNYKENYLILDLNADEVAKLATFNLEAKPSIYWQNKVDKHFSFLKKEFVKSQSKGAKARAGIPGYECYPTVEETLADGANLANIYSGLAEWVDIGDSWTKANSIGGYDLMVLKITNKNIQQEKPKLFIHSAMHARELTTAALTLDFAKQLLENYQTNADYQWIVDYHEVHILFHMNPDGRKIAETGAYQRKNTNQNHCPGDGVGVDLNRNFAFFWNTTANGSSGVECDSTYRGPSAESEPETQAVSNYIRSLFPDVRGTNDNDPAPASTSGMHLDIHSYSELVLWPYGHTNSPSPNNDAFVELGNKLAWFNDYTPQQSVGLYPTDGTSDDVSYGELGIAAFTFELGTSFFQECSDYEASVKPDNLPALVYSAKVAAAPYLLGYGPEISGIKLNNAEGEITVSQGSSVTLEITASAARTKRTNFGRQVTKIEYSIDSPIWENSTTKIELTENDGNVSSATETMSGTLDTSGLSIGKHKIFLQAYNQNNQVGVPTAVFINVAENGAPQAEFSSNCSELSCDFDATASSDTDGTVTSYQWNFNDGSTASGVTTSHTFATPGEKTITLTILDNSGNQAVANKQVELVGNQAPVADFSFTCQELRCEFDSATSSDPDGSIASFAWDFGDGNSSNSASANHTYASSGNYQVALTVTDDQGAEHSLTKSLSVSVPTPPPAQSSGGGSILWLLAGLGLVPVVRRKN